MKIDREDEETKWLTRLFIAKLSPWNELYMFRYLQYGLSQIHELSRKTNSFWFFLFFAHFFFPFHEKINESMSH